MNRWEYLKEYGVSYGQLQEYGQKGWELIYIAETSPTPSFYFKRPIEGEIDLTVALDQVDKALDKALGKQIQSLREKIAQSSKLIKEEGQ